MSKGHFEGRFAELFVAVNFSMEIVKGNRLKEERVKHVLVEQSWFF